MRKKRKVFQRKIYIKISKTGVKTIVLLPQKELKNKNKNKNKTK